MSPMIGNRRHFLATQAMGMGSVALAWLLAQEQTRGEPPKPVDVPKSFTLAPKAALAPPQANAMISFFMQGGPSHLDLFDNKPELQKHSGENFPGEIKYDNAAESSPKLFYGPWKFAKHGQCGMELSELLPGLAEVCDDITLIRSMHTGVNNHGQSIYALNGGRPTAGRPALGSWLTYGLGTENQNLPAYLVLTDPGGLPVLGVENWHNGWLPSLYQGTVIRPQEPRILNLDPPRQSPEGAQRRFLGLLENLNREHLAQHPGEHDLAARISSFELAARMQTSAREALELSQETEATQKLYGLDNPKTREFGTRCLIARRLIERGVRFVEICTGNQTWDHHGGIVTGLPDVCARTDRPTSALIKDLKQRGLLDSTLVHWGGEMGRLPVVQNEKNIGRDHNTYGFSMWLAGGGINRGCVHGATDEFGHKAVENVVNHYDYHATLFYLFGLDATKIAFPRPTGLGTILDGQPGQIVSAILETPPGVPQAG
ncbi:MAG: DUF1501 domain-containing protein [Planctomycetota bacterium]|nr:DUF1501 domain-containing protein [Planctomycetota bacterium]